LIVRPPTKNSRRIRAIVSTPFIPQPPTPQIRQAVCWHSKQGGQFWTPIAPLRGSKLHADPQAEGPGSVAARRIEDAIAIYSARVYEREHSATLLHQSWRLRDLDILEILELERDHGLVAGNADIAAAAADKAGRLNASARRAELIRIAGAVRDHPLAYAVFRERHRRRTRIEKLVEIETGWLTTPALAQLQTSVLRTLAHEGIAIETLPTSNVRISAYRRFSEHHLFRWLGLTDNGFPTVPSICIGSDDTGIFATSLRNEYASILDTLSRRLDVPRDQAMGIIERLNRTGSAYRFRPLLERPTQT
jgi:hypothetical protein